MPTDIVTFRAARRRPRQGEVRRGFTVAELVVALAVVGIAAGLALRGMAQLADGAGARAAAAEVRSAFAAARALAVRRGERAAVRLDTDAATVLVHQRGDTLLRRPLGLLYRVRLSVTRDSAAYGASGVGYGGSNLRAVVRRGAAAETVVVSRLGRVR